MVINMGMKMDIDIDHPMTLRIALERHPLELPTILKIVMVEKGYLRETSPKVFVATKEGIEKTQAVISYRETGADAGEAALWYAMFAMGSTQDRTPATRAPSWTGDGSKAIPMGHYGWMLHVTSCGVDVVNSQSPRDEQWSESVGDTFGDSSTIKNSMYGRVTCNCGVIRMEKIEVDVTHNLVDFIKTACDLTGPRLRATED